PAAERAWLGEQQEWLLRYCERKLEQGLAPDYFVFGHRHLPIDWRLSNGRSRYLNLGEWMHHNSYGVFDGQEAGIRFFEHEGQVVSNWLG
ncbi:MAG TPA: UDP-2,3-diacylglucosamine diphosphatase, partial [Saprospiraceae bacterium]|nr:UDP-2,3-diacylglucosamine diphosphatase [Saprospiraceae bacterium]